MDVRAQVGATGSLRRSMRRSSHQTRSKHACRAAMRIALLCISGMLLPACVRHASVAPSGQASPAAAVSSPTPLRLPTIAPSVLLPTPPPSATPIITPSPTPTATATSTPTPSATSLPPEDPRYGLDLSHPDRSDDFSVPYTWFQDYSDSGVSILLQGRALHITDKRADYIITWSTTSAEGSHVYAEVTAEIGACAGKDGYGLAVRVGGPLLDRGYALEFSCDGFYRLRRFISYSSAPLVLIDWTAADAINSGPNQSNRIGLAAKGAKLYAVANGVVIGQTEDFSYDYGTFGLFASANKTNGVSVIFDDFALWYLSP
jgi:hypothetical protein